MVLGSGSKDLKVHVPELEESRKLKLQGHESRRAHCSFRAQTAADATQSGSWGQQPSVDGCFGEKRGVG